MNQSPNVLTVLDLPITQTHGLESVSNPGPGLIPELKMDLGLDQVTGPNLACWHYVNANCDPVKYLHMEQTTCTVSQGGESTGRHVPHPTNMTAEPDSK